MRDVRLTWTACTLVCTHERPDDADRASCGAARGSELRDWLKARAKAEGLKGVVLTAKSSCLGVCSPLGVTIAVLPPGGATASQARVVTSDEDREVLWAWVREALQI